MADLTVIKYDPKGDPDYGLHDWGAYPSEMLQSGEPVQHGHTYLDTATSIEIPEPATFVLYGFGIAAIAMARRRKNGATA